MKFEVLKKNHLKRNIVIGAVVVIIISAIILNFTRAKYRTTQSMPLINGTVNYTPYDFKMVAMYQENRTGEYKSIDIMPSSGYVINEENSYCEIDGEKDSNARLYTDDAGQHVIANLQQGTKCYLYFDKLQLSASEIILSNKSIATRSSFSTVVTADMTGVIYQAEDYDGITYYFSGATNDNWVSFAGYYWRIIRINGNGTLRIIYAGTSTSAIGTDDQIGTSAFNSAYTDNMYVGYMYTQYDAHGLGTSSVIKGVLDNWYLTNIQNAGYSNYIDTNAGFCGDRTVINGNAGTGTANTTYAANDRLISNKYPSFICSDSRDLYTVNGSSNGNGALTYPIGLISADEVAFAGNVYGENNNQYYLYIGSSYWTMTPSNYYNYAYNFSVTTFSGPGYTHDESLMTSSLTAEYGVRPVINLRADVTISSGDGSSSKPFVIA